MNIEDFKDFESEVILTHSSWVFDKNKMPLRVHDSKFNNTINDVVDMIMQKHIWYYIPMIVFPVWKAVKDMRPNLMQNITSEQEILYLLFKSNIITLSDFFGCCEERNDGEQYWFDNDRKLVKMGMFDYPKNL